ncbi:Putative ribonuclease H protein [Dendrobium catenatum]|uniref:Ribonuclease H protein n=1 Tax=Dendrobium catenatum TaxID=906689 RepID=A0A2I0WRI6_9ASPA|nr:Putative ribonuclease H protein [Dendrobium catenatum]
MTLQTLPSIGCWNIRGFNKPEKVLAVKNLVNSHHLDMICILEAKISSSSFSDPWFSYTHQVFPNEQSCNNFSFSACGRIWLKWNSSSITFHPTSSTSQFIHGVLHFGALPPFILTVVYAANSPALRASMWHSLLELAEAISSPWIVMGDFNCFRVPGDKSGGNQTHPSRLGEFNNWIFNSGTLDLKSVGLNYTWHNGRVDDPIHIKLDRMLVNHQWLHSFPSSYYKVLPPNCSDHSPLLLSSGDNYSNANRFQFKNFWLKMDGFWDTLISSFATYHDGSPISNLYAKLKNLKFQLKQKHWNNDHFLKSKMVELCQKQNLCLEQLQCNPLDPHLNAILKDINANISSMQEAWSSWIIQRAKAKWLSNGEDDLGFLYARIKSRVNSSTIKEIVTEEGHFTSPNDIALVIVEHFRKLYNPIIPMQNSAMVFPKGDPIPVHLMEPLIAPVTDQEIKDVIFAGPSSSSPGPDGFTFEFFKGAWEIIGFYVTNAVKSFFSGAQLPRCAKASAITLIPKNKHATDISDYRPISLCNVFYKLIAKIIANRLKCVLPHIIHHSQAGFIAKRISTDNIILANEVLREFNGTSSRKFFCAKLDIRKAFDSLSWDFLISRMRDKGFPEKFIAWVKCCIQDVPFSICINGSLHGFFTSKAGLRQGCPLSPLLFVIAMDALSCSLEEGPFTGIPYGTSNLKHLLYADDVFVFGVASTANAWALSNFLKDFGSASGLHVNNAKCSILFSNNTPLANSISNILCFSPSDYHFKYLGLPISPKKLNFSHFQPLLSRISTLLDGWKVKFLSFAGRVQYLRFTIANTLAYWIRGAIIPKACIKYVDRICSIFLFHGSSQGKKLHLVAWRDTCLPINLGGIGIPSIQSLYHGFGCSFLSRMYNTKSLVFDWFRHKYVSPWKNLPTVSSKFWKFIHGIAGNIITDIKLQVSPENTFLSFFWDPWLNGNKLADFINPPTGCPDDISSYTSGNVWCIPSSFPMWLKQLISSIPLQDPSSTTLAWKKFDKPTFKTFRLLYFDNVQEVAWAKFVWHKRAALRYSAYAWLLFKNGLKTADVLAKRNIFITSTCPLCRTGIESYAHLFFSCEFSFGVLSSLLPILNGFLFRPTTLQLFEFLEEIGTFNAVEKKFCYLVICCVIYFLWRERNDRRFSSSQRNLFEVGKQVAMAISSKVSHWKAKDELFCSFPNCFAAI